MTLEHRLELMLNNVNSKIIKLLGKVSDSFFNVATAVLYVCHLFLENKYEKSIPFLSVDSRQSENNGKEWEESSSVSFFRFPNFVFH